MDKISSNKVKNNQIHNLIYNKLKNKGNFKQTQGPSKITEDFFKYYKQKTDFNGKLSVE